ncbi:MAG: DUF2202 domain-containing protein [Bacteroidales bacterium]
MKTKMYSVLIAALIIGGLSVFTSCQEDGTDEVSPQQTGWLAVSEEGYTNINTSCMQDSFVSDPEGLSEEETEGIKLMREEEKLAGDLYAKLYELHSLRIFDNISSSEQTHFEAVGTLIDYFGIDDPASSESGEYNNPELQALYDSLYTAGSESLVSGLQVGAAVEEIDILDLEELINQTNNEDIILVFENLLRGSRNHLRAFNRQLERNGVDYSPRYLEKDAFEAIINSEMERGGSGDCVGNGTGNRNRNGNGNAKGDGNRNQNKNGQDSGRNGNGQG